MDELCDMRIKGVSMEMMSDRRERKKTCCAAPWDKEKMMMNKHFSQFLMRHFRGQRYVIKTNPLYSEKHPLASIVLETITKVNGVYCLWEREAGSLRCCSFRWYYLGNELRISESLTQCERFALFQRMVHYKCESLSMPLNRYR
jgi:hypothetical protein